MAARGCPPPVASPLALALALLACAGCGRPGGSSTTAPASPPGQATGDDLRFTAFYTLHLDTHSGLVTPDDVHAGGGFATLGSDVVVLTGSGALYRVTRESDGGAVHATRLPVSSPLDLAAFDAEAPPLADRGWFRAQGVIGRRVDDGWQIFVSHHVWNAAQTCVAMAVSTATVDGTLETSVRDWSEVARLQPCLPIGGEVRGVPYAGLEAGGQLAWLSDDVLLLTTGDYQFDGLNRDIVAAQRDDYDYGKTLTIDVTTGAVSHFTKGHRNPEGLVVAADDRIWATEHGPRGGDELNLLVRGRNYGWPYATEGTDYNFPDWPPAARAPADAAFTAPVFAWVPSIGVSNLIGVAGADVPRWRGDLLVAALGWQSLFRLRLAGDRVLYAEPIRIGRRVRDVVEPGSGGFWLWTDEGDLLTLDVVTADVRGVTAFAACAGCHTIDSDGIAGGLAPNLFGVVGRPVASNASFPGYSDALRGLGGTWTEERLDRFLADPEAVVPGTTMTYRVPSAADRDALIAFLRTRR